MSRPHVRWVEPPGAGAALGERVQALGAGAALAEGRVFVDGRRETSATHLVAPASVVEVHPARLPVSGVVVLAEHAGLVFLSKPAGIATEPDHAGIGASVVAQAAELLAVPQRELHAVSRLDVGVSGVVTLARDARARDLVAELRARGAFVRRYVALASGAPEPREGSWTFALARGSRGVAHGPERDAVTRYVTVASAPPLFLPQTAAARARPRSEMRPSLLALAPVTGRTHQLRLHAERGGVPLLGDRAHGGSNRLLLANGAVRGLERVCLHAAWVELEIRGERLRVLAPLPDDLTTLWRELGRSDDDWTRALEIALPPIQS